MRIRKFEVSLLFVIALLFFCCSSVESAPDNSEVLQETILPKYKTSQQKTKNTSSDKVEEKKTSNNVSALKNKPTNYEVKEDGLKELPETILETKPTDKVIPPLPQKAIVSKNLIPINLSLIHI